MSKAITLEQLELHALKGANYTDKKVNELREDVADALEGIEATPGADGIDGEDGYTPVKGVDYFTDADKAEIIAACSQIGTPQIVSSVEEMTDTSKHYVLDGYIYSNRKVKEQVITSPNVFVPSTAQLNTRLSGSSGSASASNGYFVTDFIAVPNFASLTPYNMRLNWEMPTASPADDCKVLFYNSSKTKIGYYVIAASGYTNNNTTVSDGKTVVNLKIDPKGTSVTASDVAFVKIQLALKTPLAALTINDIANCEVTLDANNVTETVTVTKWVNSGITYAPSFKTDLVGVLGEGDVIYLSDNLPSGKTYTLKYPDNNYAIIGEITK